MRTNEQLLEHAVTLTPTRLPEPPPAVRGMARGMVRGVARGASSPEQEVGWVDGDTVGFRGFANEHDAMGAAWVAYRTLARRVAIRAGERPIPVEMAATSVAGDGVTIMAAGRAIATLIRPDAEGRPGDSFGFSLQLPAPEGEHSARAMAHLVYRTLRRSGVRWDSLDGQGASSRARRGGAAGRHGRPAARGTAPSPRRGPVWWAELHDMLRGVAWRDVAWRDVTVRALALMGVLMLALALLLGGARMAPVIGMALVGILGARVLATLREPDTPRGGQPTVEEAIWPMWDRSGAGRASLS